MGADECSITSTGRLPILGVRMCPNEVSSGQEDHGTPNPLLSLERRKYVVPAFLFDRESHNADDDLGSLT